MNGRPLSAFAAALLAGSLTACLNDEDGPRQLTHVETGALSELVRVEGESTTLLQWLLIPEEGAQLKGQCNYMGYLGDSAGVNGEPPNLDSLYTNTSMGGTRTAALIRSAGVILSRDTGTDSTWRTHYRAEFDCTY